MTIMSAMTSVWGDGDGNGNNYADDVCTTPTPLMGLIRLLTLLRKTNKQTNSSVLFFYGLA